jgi:hypothetical protein
MEPHRPRSVKADSGPRYDRGCGDSKDAHRRMGRLILRGKLLAGESLLIHGDASDIGTTATMKCLIPARIGPCTMFPRWRRRMKIRRHCIQSFSPVAQRGGGQRRPCSSGGRSRNVPHDFGQFAGTDLVEEAIELDAFRNSRALAKQLDVIVERLLKIHDRQAIVIK